MDDEDDENGGGLFNTENLSVYVYAHQNPIKYNDPYGRCPTCIVGALVGAAVDYGVQVGANYMNKDVKNPWTDNISISSIVLAGVEGGLTQGASVGRRAFVKGTAIVANNIVDYNTTKGGKLETDGRNIVKNVIIDATVGKVTRGTGKLAKTSKFDKVSQKLVLSNNKSTTLLKKTPLNSKQANTLTKKFDAKGVSKQRRSESSKQNT